jgi:RNA polymerase sigma factor (sigma-70 family)
VLRAQARPRRTEEEGLATAPSIGRATGVERAAYAAEAEAARSLYERHHGLVLRYCRSRLRTREEAEDAAQTTFFYALGALRRGVVPQSETAWLLKIAHNVCLKRWDATRRRSRVEVGRDPQLLEEVAAVGGDAESELAGLDEALRRLPDQQRRAILLREWQGLSYADVADELGVTRSAVETLIFRARRSLARELRGDRKVGSLDVGSLLAGLKSLLVAGGTTAKVAAGTAAVVSVGAVAAVPALRHERQPAQAPVPPAPAPAVVASHTPEPVAATPVSVQRADARPGRGRASAPARLPARTRAVPAPAAPTAPRPASPPRSSPAPVAPSSPPPPAAPAPAPDVEVAAAPPPTAQQPAAEQRQPPPPAQPPTAPPSPPPPAAAPPPPPPPPVVVVEVPKAPPVEVPVPGVPPVAVPELPPVQVPAVPGVDLPPLPPISLPELPPVEVPPLLPPPRRP